LRVSARPLPDCDVYLLPARGLPPSAELSALQASGAAVLAYGAPELLRAAFLAGCDDFLKEPWSPEELECRLERLERLGRARPPGVSARLSWGELTVRGGRVRSAYGEASLSHPESAILAALLSHPGEAVRREVLAYAAWGRPCAAGSRALDAHLSSLRRKLRGLAPPGLDAGQAVRIRALRGVGYALG
jgi:DNA-binding response OmpR family regulator